MSYEYVKRYYGVHPKLGQRVFHTEIKEWGTVIRKRRGYAGHYVFVRFDGRKLSSPCHPLSLYFSAKQGG